MTISELPSTSSPKRRNCSALLAILSTTFISEKRTDILIPEAPSPQTAIANKNGDTSLHKKW